MMPQIRHPEEEPSSSKLRLEDPSRRHFAFAQWLLKTSGEWWIASLPARRDQRLRHRMRRRGEHRRHVAGLDDAAVVEHGDAVAQQPRDGEIVA